MPKLFGLELARRSIALRALAGGAVAAILMLLLCALPLMMPSMIGGLAPEGVRPAAAALIMAMVPPYLPAIGALAAAAAFSAVLARGSRAYGPLTLLLGALSLAYALSAFHWGAISIQIPPSALNSMIQPIRASSISLDIAIDWNALMAICALPPSLVVLKGIFLTMRAAKPR